MMRQLVIFWMIVLLLDFSGAQQCISNCPDGTGLVFPLSYNTIKPHEFNGAELGIEGCTDSVSVDGQVTIECGQGSLIDCDRGFNGGDYSDLAGTFIWNRTASVAQQVSIVFRFDQQINISRISMFFWNSPSSNITVPNVMMMYWSNDDSITPSNVINITPSNPNRNDDKQSRLNVLINDVGLQFQYLRIVMSFYDDSEWIFLSDVQFCGNEAPHRITQPSIDNDVQILSDTATMATLTCSLNVTIPSSMIITWTHNNTIIPVNQTSTTGSDTTLTIENPQSSDDGVYQCVFNDTAGYTLSRRIIFLTSTPQVIHPPAGLYTETFYESTTSVPLMCSLNIDIPSGVTVTWTRNGNHLSLGPSDSITQAGTTTTLIIGNPQPSDAGVYQCSFRGIAEDPIGRSIQLVFQNTSSMGSSAIIVPPTSETSSSSVSVIGSDTAETANFTMSVMQTTGSMVVTIQMTSTTQLINMSSTATPIISNSNPETGGRSDDGGSNVGAIVAPIVVILFLLVIVIIVLVIVFFMWNRRQHKYKIDEHYYSSVTETKLKSLTVDSNTLITRLGGPLNSDSTRSTAPLYAVPNRDSKREQSKNVEKTQSTLSNQSSSPPVPDRTSRYDEVVDNPFYDKRPNGIAEPDGDSVDDELLDDSFDEDEGPTPLHSAKKGVSPRRSKSKSPSKTPTKKSKQPSSSSAQSNLLSPLKSVGSHSSAADSVGSEGDKTLKSIHNSMHLNPMYTSSQSLNQDDKNIELNIYDSIQSPKHKDVQFTESIYSEIAEPNTLITTETPQVGSVKDAKDLYPYSSIYAEPLPLNKSESPPLVAAENLLEVKLLGTGQFGEVVLANTAGLSKYYLQLGASEDCTVSIKVAVKKLKLNSTKEMQQAFEKEIKFMSRLKDNNVIRLLGICTTGTPFIMMEYMENGDLNQYLQQFELLLDPDEAPSSKEITLVTLIYMAFQISSGMKYLSSLKYVHRDLATRNILVGKDYVVKIADFGMSQNLYSAYYFKVKGRAILPIRWMAYECFFGRFSVKTDVWAFGITLWEIFTLAKEQPYNDMGDQEVIDSALKGENRLLMNKPENCPDEIYEVMLRCWVHDATKRATFAALYETLKEINNRQ